ncbi:MAG TPA: hypothetical protein VM925_34415 [Labilithrix sp.]|nr:hypothetical protein [Labilithrix sp.]
MNATQTSHFPRGFLPPNDPVPALSVTFAAWEEIGRALPKLLVAGRALTTLDELPVLPAESLGDAELERAMGLLSFMGHAAVWEDWKAGQGPRVPRGVAVPWTHVAARVGRPPALAYPSHVLHNWRRLDPTQPIGIGNLAVLQNFYGGLDEDWFIHIHIDIEAKAIPAVHATEVARDAAESGDRDTLLSCLRDVAGAQSRIHETLCRIPERCDPFIFFNRIQPFFHGFKEVLYEGVGSEAGERRTFLGGSAAQSVFTPLVDALLGISHAEDALISYLRELRVYMPSLHRAFLEEVERTSAVRRVVTSSRDAALVSAYNECIEWVRRFREEHIEVAAVYIQRQAKKRQGEIGTGGTPYMQYLKKHLDETAAHRIA